MQTTIRGRLTCFCRVCYVMWYGQEECDEWYVMYEIDHVLVIGITTCMSMSMTTGRSHRSCLYFLYDLRVIEECHVTYFTLLLNALSIEVEVVVGVTTSWRHDDGDHDDGDHGVMPVTRWSWSPKMEIKGAIWYWPYHVTIIWLHVMFIMFMHLICLEQR